MFSKAELVLMASLLNLAAERFGDHSCNDFELTATEDNLALAKQARSANDTEDPSVVNGKIFSSDFLLMYLLEKRCKEELAKLP